MLVRRLCFEGAERGERTVGAGAVLALSFHSEPIHGAGHQVAFRVLQFRSTIAYAERSVRPPLVGDTLHLQCVPQISALASGVCGHVPSQHEGVLGGLDELHVARGGGPDPLAIVDPVDRAGRPSPTLTQTLQGIGLCTFDDLDAFACFGGGSEHD